MLDDLIELLKKIVSQRKPVGLVNNYDGNKSRWQVKIGNMKAEDFNLAITYDPKVVATNTAECSLIRMSGHQEAK